MKTHISGSRKTKTRRGSERSTAKTSDDGMLSDTMTSEKSLHSDDVSLDACDKGFLQSYISQRASRAKKVIIHFSIPYVSMVVGLQDHEVDA